MSTRVSLRPCVLSLRSRWRLFSTTLRRWCPSLVRCLVRCTAPYLRLLLWTSHDRYLHTGPHNSRYTHRHTHTGLYWSGMQTHSYSHDTLIIILTSTLYFSPDENTIFGHLLYNCGANPLITPTRLDVCVLMKLYVSDGSYLCQSDGPLPTHQGSVWASYLGNTLYLPTR